ELWNVSGNRISRILPSPVGFFELRLNANSQDLKLSARGVVCGSLIRLPDRAYIYANMVRLIPLLYALDQDAN
ncbi:hypothetical protein M5D96_009672, partial [Drosophila gunungcola]